MTNAMNAIANQVIRNSGRSARNAGWPYFDSTFRDYPAFKRKFASFRANYHHGRPTQELFQQFHEMCLPERIVAKLKSAETMETAFTRLDAWFGDRGLYIKDLTLLYADWTLSRINSSLTFVVLISFYRRRFSKAWIW